MSTAISTYTSPHCGHATFFTAQDNGLGALFADHGAAFIAAYNPPKTVRKLVQDMAYCRTPKLGSTAYICKSCGDCRYVYKSCGNSRCPKCQGIKRLKWQDKLASRMLRCPYVHMVFTMPHALNGLARRYPKDMYNCLFRSANASLLKCCANPDNLGAKPGAIMVLHTFGSDLKYHVHVHALVTFGGIDPSGKWRWPKHKKRLVRYRQISKEFKNAFMNRLRYWYKELPKHTMIPTYEDIEKDVGKKRWCVHSEYPTANTEVLREYLGRYICRIGLSRNRFFYDRTHQQVTLTFKDYRNKNKTTGQVPKGIKKMNPLVAINQILQHSLPRYFQKCRYTGLHAFSATKKYKKLIPKKIKNNTRTIRTLFQLLHQLLGIPPHQCTVCGGTDFEQEILAADSSWDYPKLIYRPQNKGPTKQPTYQKKPQSAQSGTGSVRPIATKNVAKTTLSPVKHP